MFLYSDKNKRGIFPDSYFCKNLKKAIEEHMKSFIVMNLFSNSQ